MERVREEKSVERRSEERKNQKKEDGGARKGEKSRNMVFFSMFCGSGGSRSRLAKTAGSHLGR